MKPSAEMNSRLLDDDTAKSAGALLREGDPAVFVSGPFLERIENRLRAATRSGPKRRKSMLPWAMGVAWMSVAAFGAYWHVRAPSVRAPPSAAPEPISVPLAVPLLPPVAAMPSGRPPVRPSESESALTVETRLIEKAVSEIRLKKNPRAALVTLNEYASRFPKGMLRNEALLARIDALLLLGRRTEVVSLFEATPLEMDALPRQLELRVLRGELLADASRCGEALPFFDEVLAADSTSLLSERALFGRAVCLAKIGRERESENDLSGYLDRFPTGRFVEQVRKALKR